MVLENSAYNKFRSQKFLFYLFPYRKQDLQKVLCSCSVKGACAKLKLLSCWNSAQALIKHAAPKNFQIEISENDLNSK